MAGESYAGVYIPYFAKDILEKNQNSTTPKVVTCDQVEITY